MMDEVFAEFYKKINYPLSVRKEKNAAGRRDAVRRQRRTHATCRQLCRIRYGRAVSGRVSLTFRVSAFSGRTCAAYFLFRPLRAV